MNIALFALAVLMIVGGIAAVIQGFPFVRLESGMAMTVAGATSASAGAVVLGLATVVSHLQGLARRLNDLRVAAPLAVPSAAPVAEAAPARAFELPASGPGSAGPSFTEPTFAEPTFTDPSASDDRTGHTRPNLGAIGLGAVGLGLAGLNARAAEIGEAIAAGPQGRGTEPTFLVPPEPAAASAPEPVEPLLTDLPPPASEPVPPVVAEPAALEAAPPMAETVAQDDPPAQPVLDATAEPLRLYPTLDTTEAAPEPVPAPAAVEPQPEIAEPKPDVVGTYKSGGNTYVMFSNGMIEAETPRGRFTFGSLDELKDFVRAGGESDARGAA